MPNTVLIVDDDAKVRKSIIEILSLKGFKTIETSAGKDAVELFRMQRPSVVLLDLGMPEMDGMEVLGRLRQIDSIVPVIMVTASTDIQSAVNAIKQGAYDFLVKPLNFGHLELTIKNALDKAALQRRVEELDTSLNLSLETELGQSRQMKKLIAQVRRVARSGIGVLIQGETGTGKTYLAKVIHRLGARADKPFIKVSIGSLQDSVVESELFGHERGAFTGAEKGRKGYFEMSDQGTLLIDDIDNISPAIQGKLLNIVEDRQVFRVGSAVPIPLDTRIICATNADLLKLVSEGKFREDLYFRLGEFTLNIPPLRERRDDISFFARQFLMDACHEMEGSTCFLTEETIEFLENRPWPGNLRQLRNAMKRAAILADNDTISPVDMEAALGESAVQDGRSTDPSNAMTMKEAEKIAIENALSAAGGQKVKAAALLQIDYKTLVRKMAEYGITLLNLKVL